MVNPFVAGWKIGGPQTLKRRSLVGQREDELEGEVGCCFRTNGPVRRKSLTLSHSRTLALSHSLMAFLTHVARVHWRAPWSCVACEPTMVTSAIKADRLALSITVRRFRS